MKSTMFAAMSIMGGLQNVVLSGGFESMSNIPYHIPKARAGLRLGDGAIVDGLVSDGLWDPYDNKHMGVCGEVCAAEYKITREEQDDYALQSYARAQAAWAAGTIAQEVVPVDVGAKGKEKLVTEDAEFKLLKVGGCRVVELVSEWCV
jgi:acetyl-CoA C-acetyltransferase